MTENNNGAAPGGDDAAARQLIINAQYVKDLSFENPRAPQSLLQPQQPEVSLGVDVKAQNLAPDVYEVVLTVQANAKHGTDSIFVAELAYAAVITLKNVPQDALGLALLVEAPRLMFPFARAIISNVTRDGGYPPLLVHPIDFAELLRQQQAQQASGPIATA